MNNSAHVKFLEMLGWEGEELQEFLPEWLRAAKLLGLSDRDVAFAVEKWIPAYWDLSLAGVRKYIAACIRGVVEIAKGADYQARGDKLIYVNMPSVPVLLGANRIASGGHVHAFYTSYLMISVLTAFFNKNSGKNMDFDEEPGCFRSPCANCALNRLRLRMCSEGRLPRPNVAWSWGLRCSESPKTDEMVGCIMHGADVNVTVTIPHDAPSGVVEADYAKKVDLLTAEMRLAQEKVSEATGWPVSDDDVRRAMDDYLEYMDRIQTLTDLVMTADSLPISGGELTLFGLCVELCLSIDVNYIIDALDTIIAEVRERIEKGIGLAPRNAPRLACHFNPLATPWLDKAFRDSGVCLVQGKLFPFADKFRGFVAEESDIYRALARICLSIPSTMNMLDEARINAEMLTRYPVDGALYGFYSSDSWVGALQKTMVQVIEAETGVPHFYIEGSLWAGEDTDYDSRRAIVRSICNYLKISNI